MFVCPNYNAYEVHDRFVSNFDRNIPDRMLLAWLKYFQLYWSILKEKASFQTKLGSQVCFGVFLFVWVSVSLFVKLSVYLFV